MHCACALTWSHCAGTRQPGRGRLLRTHSLCSRRLWSVSNCIIEKCIGGPRLKCRRELRCWLWGLWRCLALLLDHLIWLGCHLIWLRCHLIWLFRQIILLLI